MPFLPCAWHPVMSTLAYNIVDIIRLKVDTCILISVLAHNERKLKILSTSDRHLVCKYLICAACLWQQMRNVNYMCYCFSSCVSCHREQKNTLLVYNASLECTPGLKLIQRNVFFYMLSLLNTCM